MTRFDADVAPRDPTYSISRDVRSLIASQPAVFAVMVAVGCVAVAMAIGILAVGQGIRAQVALAIGRTQASVFLAPQLARADADALRGRIESLPVVARAILRTREEALTALASDGLPALVNKPNPLPDVWIVTLRLPAQGATERPLSIEASAARETLATLPGVESVTIDERWIAVMDRGASLAARLVFAVDWLVFVALAALLVCVAFVTGRAYRTGAGGRAGRIGAMAGIGALSGVLSVLIAAIAVWGIQATLTASGVDLKPIVDQGGQSLIYLVGGIGAVAILAPLAGLALGGIR